MSHSMPHPSLEPRATGSLATASSGEGKHCQSRLMVSRRLPEEDAAGNGMEVRRPMNRERLDVQRGFLEPRRIVDDEGECAEEDLMTHAQIFAGRHDEKMKSQTRRKSLRRLPHGGRQLSWV